MTAGPAYPTPAVRKRAVMVAASPKAGATEAVATTVESKRLRVSARRVVGASRSGTGAPKGPGTSGGLASLARSVVVMA